MKETEFKKSICKIGDIVRVKDCHHAEPHFYEVSYIKTDYSGNAYAVSQPADFSHRFEDVTAIYRYDGKDLKCIFQEDIVMSDRLTDSINFDSLQGAKDLQEYEERVRDKIREIFNIPKGIL
jgi:hypothetical protein